MTDIVERLTAGVEEPYQLMREARDEIAGLRAGLLANARLMVKMSDEYEAARAEAETWKHRYEAEYAEHLATISECGGVLAEAGLDRE